MVEVALLQRLLLGRTDSQEEQTLPEGVEAVSVELKVRRLHLEKGELDSSRDQSALLVEEFVQCPSLESDCVCLNFLGFKII